MARAPIVSRRSVVSRATLLGALVAGIVVLGGLLASEAWRAARSGQATARRALESHAAVAAWEFLRGVEDEFDALAGDALAPVVAARASTPFDSLPSPGVLAASFSRGLACPDPGVPRRFIRVDLRDGALVVHGAALDEGERRWLVDTLRLDAASFAPGRRDAVILGGGAHEDLALVYGVKFAGYGAPVAAYALVTCPEAFGAPVFERVMSRRALLPDASLAGQANDSVIALSVRDRHGHPIWRSGGGEGERTTYTAVATLARAGGLTVQSWLRPSAVERLAAEPLPRMRLGVLVALLALVTGLAVVALVQLRREQDLARLRADFTSSVSHELRTPLAQIMLFGETLALDRFRTSEERQFAAGTIVQEARRLMHMVDNVLHFARSERGVSRVQPRAEPLAPIVREAVRAFAALAEDVRFAESVEEGTRAMVDAGALRQVLLNLLDNAVKYGPAGQVVTVGVSSVGGRARVWVDDQGHGVPPEERVRVFEPYVRLPQHQGASFGGSGIGLAVVREIAELHGGRVQVSEAPGGGARFAVELPLADEPAGSSGGGSAGGGAPPHSHHVMGTSEVHHPASPARIMGAPPQDPGATRRPPSLPGAPA